MLFGFLIGILEISFIYFTGTLFQVAYEKKMFKIYFWIFIIIGVFIFEALIKLFKRIILARIFPLYFHKTRMELLKNFFSIIYKKIFKKGVINNAISNDLPSVVNKQSSGIFQMSEAITSFCIVVVLLFRIHWIVGLANLIIIIFFILMPTPFFKKIGKYSKTISEINSNFYGKSVAENKNKEQYIYTRNLNLYHKNMIDYIDSFGKQKIIQNLKLNIFSQFFYFLVRIMYDVPLILGAIIYNEGYINFGDIAILTLISNATIGIGTKISDTITKFASIKPIKYKYKYKFSKLKDIKNIEFINVIPKKNKKNLTSKPINFKIKNGKNYLIKGKNGSGKSSLLNILDHNIKYKGKIKINGKIVKNLNKFFIVRSSQNFCLFNSINDLEKNIDTQDNKIYHEIKAIVNQYVNLLKIKNNPSQGEIQILSLLHMLANKPQIIIIDETLVSVAKNLKNEIYEAILRINIGVVIVDHTISKKKEGVFDEIISF